MKRIATGLVVCLMLVCPLLVGGVWAAACNTSGDAFVNSGWSYVKTDTKDLSSALNNFDTAIGVSPTCSAAYVARALIKVAQLYDTTDVKNLRSLFGDTKTFDTLTIDTNQPGNGNYTYSSATMDAKAFQGVLGGVVLSTLNSALTDIQSAEGTSDSWEMAVAGRFLSEDTRGIDAEVDNSDVYFFKSMLLAAKAFVYIATAYNADAQRDWRQFHDADNDGLPDGDTFIKHVQDTSTFLQLRTGSSDSFVTNAAVFIQLADTAFLTFLNLTDGETNVEFLQDTDLFASLGNARIHGRDSGIFDYVDDTDVADYTRDHNDTILRSMRGDTLSIQLRKENQDLSPIQLRPKVFFESPFDRNVFPTSSTVLTHGIEFDRESAFPRPTFNGFLPNATNNDLFLLATEVDSFFIVTSLPKTINLNSLSKLPEEIDVKFDIPSGSGNVVIARSVSSSNICTITVSPKTNAAGATHLRIFFRPENDFTSTDRGLMRTMLDSTLIYVVPWRVASGHAVDAGRVNSVFTTYYNNTAGTDTNRIDMHWLKDAGDTYMMFRFGSDADLTEFKTLSSSASVSSPATGQTLVGADINRFGWFALGDTAAALKVLVGALAGETEQFLANSFSVKVVNEFGTAIPGVPVTFSEVSIPTSSSVGLFSPSSVTTGAATSTAPGIATALYRLGSGYGIYKLKATADGGNFAYLFAFSAGITPHNSANLWRMVSMPAYPAAAVPAPSVGETTPLGRLGPATSPTAFVGDDYSSYKIYYWDPSQTTAEAGFNDVRHEHYVTPSASGVIQGRAYWLKTTTNANLDANLSGTATHSHVEDVADSIKPDTVIVPLKVGWNQIATPYSFSINWKDILVDTGFKPSLDTPVSIESVDASGHLNQICWISPTNTASPLLAGYSCGPNPSGANPEVALFPFGGYWIEVATSCTLVFPVKGSGTFMTGNLTTDATGGSGGAAAPYIMMSASNAPKSSTNWTVQLYVQSQTGMDYENFAGVRPTASAAAIYSEPPLMPGGVSLAFVEAGKKYSQLLKTSGEALTWNVELTSASAGEITITAANVSSVPGQTPVMLRDETSGRVTDLRSSGYTYTSGADETRQFTFSAATLEPGMMAKIMYPAACLFSRFISHPAALESLRAMRDQLLRAFPGRVFVSLYYSVAGFR